MASPNFKYEKRQKELAKQKKNEEKRLRKLAKRNGKDTGDELAVPDEIVNAEDDVVDADSGSE